MIIYYIKLEEKMDKKVLVFTNYGSWFRGLTEITKRVDWYDSYPEMSTPLVKCVSEPGTETTLQPVDNLSAEGVYLVFDEISQSMLASLLDQCKQNNDRLFILLHTRGYYTDSKDFESWQKNCSFAKGMHESGVKYKYEPVFDILTDKLGDTLNRITDSIFMPLDNAINNFLDECAMPKKKLENLLSYHILCEEGFKEELEAFLKKYESCQSYLEYAEEWDRLKDLLKSDSEK